LTEPRGTILAVSSAEEDHLALRHIFRNSSWKLDSAGSWREAAKYLATLAPPVVICEVRLPDGTWKDVLSEFARLECESGLIVASRSADDYLWAEVLNLGGCDVLAKPFDAKEVLWAATMAWTEWRMRLGKPRRAARIIQA
jgi:DNA-binding NtrC family response regulator